MKRTLPLAALCVFTASAHAATYYVTVAGLGGEPDYEQRFTAAARDLDKVFKGSGSNAHVATLTGTQATAAQLKLTLAEVARQIRPEDDFVLILIGHGSFDGTEYKFNLVGPDPSASELAAMCDRIPARRQLISIPPRPAAVPSRPWNARAVPSSRPPNLAPKERDGLHPLLGRSPAGPRRRH